MNIKTYIQHKDILSQVDELTSMLKDIGMNCVMECGRTPRLPNGRMNLKRIDAIRAANQREQEAGDQLIQELKAKLI
jgi:hypothetical protein